MPTARWTVLGGKSLFIFALFKLVFLVDTILRISYYLEDDLQSPLVGELYVNYLGKSELVDPIVFEQGFINSYQCITNNKLVYSVSTKSW